MSTWIKFIWIATTLINLSVFVWFLVGATSNFQRSLDLVGIPIILFYGIPSLIVNIISIVILIRKWNAQLSVNTMIVGGVFIFILLFCTPAFVTALQNTVKSDQVESDTVSYISDQKY